MSKVVVRYIDEYGDVVRIERTYSGAMLEGFMKTVAASQGVRNPSYFFPVPNSDGTHWDYISANKIVRISIDMEEESGSIEPSNNPTEEE